MDIKYNGVYHRFFLIGTHPSTFCGVFWMTLVSLALYALALLTITAMIAVPVAVGWTAAWANKVVWPNGFIEFLSPFFYIGYMAAVGSIMFGIGWGIWLLFGRIYDYLYEKDVGDKVASISDRIADSTAGQFIASSYEQFKDKTCKLVNFKY